MFHGVAITDCCVACVTVQSCDKLQCVTRPLTTGINQVENLRTIYERLLFRLLLFIRCDFVHNHIVFQDFLQKNVRLRFRSFTIVDIVSAM